MPVPLERGIKHWYRVLNGFAIRGVTRRRCAIAVGCGGVVVDGKDTVGRVHRFVVSLTGAVDALYPHGKDRNCQYCSITIAIFLTQDAN